MPELEKVIEDKLIEQLVFGESQWTYREDLKTEEDLWQNFRYILEQNNKARLDGQPLSDAEFEQVKKWEGNGSCAKGYRKIAFSCDES